MGMIWTRRMRRLSNSRFVNKKISLTSKKTQSAAGQPEPFNATCPRRHTISAQSFPRCERVTSQCLATTRINRNKSWRFVYLGRKNPFVKSRIKQPPQLSKSKGNGWGSAPGCQRLMLIQAFTLCRRAFCSKSSASLLNSVTPSITTCTKTILCGQPLACNSASIQASRNESLKGSVSKLKCKALLTSAPWLLTIEKLSTFASITTTLSG